MALFMTLL